jgi:hypothetical protein
MPRIALSIATFVAVAILSVVAAAHRFEDSAHAIGMISKSGGRARHPIQVAAGLDRYTFIVTATVIPPYRGDVAVTVDGPGRPEVDVAFTEPVIDLGLRRRPGFRDGVLTGLEPKDRIALWVVLKNRNGSGGLHGKHHIVFRDLATDRPVLTVPVILGSGGGEHHDH